MNSIMAIDISIFDHWLSEIEAETCKIMSYSIAINNGLEAEYLLGEDSFINLYKSISDNAICGYKKSGTVVNTNSKEFKDYVINGLRKENFKISYPAENIEVIGGYDRTDMIVIYSYNEKQLASLITSVEKNNLFILGTKLMSKTELAS